MGGVYSCQDLLAAIAAIEALMCPEAGYNWSAEALVEMRATLDLYRALVASSACGGDGAQGSVCAGESATVVGSQVNVDVAGASPGRRRAKNRRRG